MVVTEARAVETLDPLATRTLETRLLGEIISPGDEAYEEARHIHNLLIDRRPALIVRTADAGDVIRAVEFARARDLPLAVRGGSHSLAGHSTVDGGVVVDLSRMKGLSVDPERRTVWAQPGVTSGDLVEAAQPHGLALSTGDTASVGLGGLTLGGGIGWMVRKHGLTIDKLLSVEIVTADGRIIVASEKQHPVTLRSGYLSELSDEAIAIILDHYNRFPAPFGVVQVRGLGGAMGRVPADATAFAHRDKPLMLAAFCMGAEKTDRLWVTELWRKLRPHASGVYVNFLEDEGEARILEAYSPATYARLAAVKRLYDPTNLFRLNQNIRPAG